MAGPKNDVDADTGNECSTIKVVALAISSDDDDAHTSGCTEAHSSAICNVLGRPCERCLDLKS